MIPREYDRHAAGAGTLPALPGGLSVVVPVFNSQESLPLLVSRLLPALRSCASDYEIILVNDGSRDRSWDAIEKLVSASSWVRGINLMRNYGQHNALLCGIRAARFDAIVTIDDDLQNPPEEIPRLLAKLHEGYDVVYGTPQVEQHGLWRDMASRLTKMALQSATGSEVARKVSAYRVFRTQVRDAFADYASPHISIDVLLTWGTTRYAAISVKHDSREIGASNYTFWKLVTHAINMLTGFSTVPLRVATFMGFAFTVFGLGVLTYVLVRYLISGSSVPGFPFMASLVAIFSGAQMFALGIIGEYLSRMHFRMMDRPSYTVRQATEMKT